MSEIRRTALTAYQRYADFVSLLQHPLLLACRLYWGWDFVVKGFNTLAHVQVNVEYFTSWNVPLPHASVIACGTAELFCGSLLLIGLASRIATLPLIFTMIVAYLTAHADEVTSLETFASAAPFFNLLTCVLVFLFGPGVFSLDWLLGRLILGRPVERSALHNGQGSVGAGRAM
jgi:putative oxidoreductase